MSPHRAPAPADPALAAHATRIAALRPAIAAAAGVADAKFIETHISSLLLAGEFAWKFKKPLDLGFLDFSSVEARRRCCEAEVRLNRRTAPALYLEAVPVTGSDAAPALGGAGAPIDWAVKMRRFADDATLDQMLGRGALTPEIVDALAQSVAEFHAGAAVADPEHPLATPRQVLADALENFDHVARLGAPEDSVDRLAALRAWTEHEGEARAATFAARKHDGFVRECHGDLHLDNVALVDGRPLPFDCIEFNESFRWIDVMSEIAFTVMDLIEHGRADLGWRFLDRYLEVSGDHAGLGVLRWYLVFRAMVRAKVALIRARQVPAAEAGAALEAFGQHVALAGKLTETPPLRLLLVCGLSGSGKTTIAGQLLERLGAIRLRSDIERKRLFGLAPGARTGSALDGGIYTEEATRATVARLEVLAREVLAAGWPTIVDAVFLHAAERARFMALSRVAGAAFNTILCEAPATVLRERIRARNAAGRDASEATLEVLARQQTRFEAPGNGEALLRCDTTDPHAIGRLVSALGAPAPETTLW